MFTSFKVFSIDYGNFFLYQWKPYSQPITSCWMPKAWPPPISGSEMYCDWRPLSVHMCKCFALYGSVRNYKPQKEFIGFCFDTHNMSGTSIQVTVKAEKTGNMLRTVTQVSCSTTEGIGQVVICFLFTLSYSSCCELVV